MKDTKKTKSNSLTKPSAESPQTAELHQTAGNDVPVLTTQQGVPVSDDQNTLRWAIFALSTQSGLVNGARRNRLGRVVSYEPQAGALSAYFLGALPAAVPNSEGRDDWRVGVSDQEETPFAVSDPFRIRNRTMARDVLKGML